ncbi:MAG: hypothetical protein Q8S84_08210 [bacterium]|nr:hypothetical protein [bacterium]
MLSIASNHLLFVLFIFLHHNNLHAISSAIFEVTFFTALEYGLSTISNTFSLVSQLHCFISMILLSHVSISTP